jgi:TolA-binding protein
MARNRPILPALDARPGPAERISEERARVLVDGAIESVFARRPRWMQRAFARPWGRGALVLAATFVVGMAAAATVRTWLRPARAPVAPVASVAPERQAIPETAGVPLPPRVVDGIAPPEPPVAAPLAPAESSSRESAPHVRPPPAPPAEDLLQQANDLRAARRWRDAARMYERVLAAHPGSAEAYAAAVAAAELRLEQMGDPSGALRLYRAALQKNPQGPLSEQAVWGVARCQRALAEREGERSALRDYLSRYPSGLFAPSARERLDALP